MTTIGGRFVWACLAAAWLAGCDGSESNRQPLTVNGPAATATTTPGDAPPPRTYEDMCRHYCDSLEETDLYACLSDGQGDADACAARVAGIAVGCDEGRCAPKLVDPPLCFKQCDSLAKAYDAFCATAAAPGAECATPPREHDDACRTGCAFDAP